MIKETTIGDINTILNFEQKFSNFASYNLKQLEQMIHNPNYCNYSLFEDDKLIGYLISIITDDSIDLLKIFIDTSKRNKGYGTQLLSMLIDKHAFNKNIHVEVETTNDVAIQFYLHNGFSKIDEKKDYYGKNKTAFTMIRRPQ
jgi:ribosomal-protein-alanine N-acetyltransferase